MRCSEPVVEGGSIAGTQIRSSESMYRQTRPRREQRMEVDGNARLLRAVTELSQAFALDVLSCERMYARSRINPVGPQTVLTTSPLSKARSKLVVRSLKAISESLTEPTA